PTGDYAGAGATAPTTGHVAATLGFDGTSILADFLYRFAVPGMPEANRMHTSIDMLANDINNLKRITGSGGGNSIDLSTANRIDIQDDLSVNRDTTTGRDLSVGRGATIAGAGLAGQPSLTLLQGDLKVGQGSLDVAQDATVGRDATIGRDAVVEGQVYTDVFASKKGVNYAVSPLTTTTVSTLNPDFLNADTMVYGSAVGKGISTPSPSSAQVLNAAKGMPFEAAQKYIRDISAQYDAEVKSRAGTATSAVRLGDLLPSYVARGMYVIQDTGEVMAYQGSQFGVINTSSVVPKPTNSCGIGEPQIYLSKMEDSYSYSKNLGELISVSTTPGEVYCPPHESVGGPCSQQGGSTSVSAGTLNIDLWSTANVRDDGTVWSVTFNSSPPGRNQGVVVPRKFLAQTFCHYRFP
ncbi:shufflon system plasmid conjugative transfer pilus tip adhesin PilV, partial [Methylobacterium hispanicum]